jgi:peptide-methionine (R)-S-oxide reductase
MTTRRSFLLNSASLTGLGIAAGAGLMGCGEAVADEKFEVTHTDQEWRKLLAPDAYEILRHADTEQPGTSPLLNEHRAGIFTCAGCDLPLFSSTTKFESGTGWPSFYQPLAKTGAVIEKRDMSLGMIRTEVLCHRCGGHLGHVFDDGPRPTGLRYCMNGAAMKFVPGKTA